jgi:hypothetical protein
MSAARRLAAAPAPQTPTLRIPRGWPLAWWSGDGSLVRMACPNCGNFSAYLTLPSNAIECRTCDLRGLEAFQREFLKRNQT